MEQSDAIRYVTMCIFDNDTNDLTELPSTNATRWRGAARPRQPDSLLLVGGHDNAFKGVVRKELDCCVRYPPVNVQRVHAHVAAQQQQNMSGRAFSEPCSALEA